MDPCDIFSIYETHFSTARGSFLYDEKYPGSKQNRSTEGCSKLKRSVDMTSSGKH